MINELKNLKINEIIKLPQPKTKGELSVEEAIFTRRSVRSFEDKPLTLEQISQLLWSAQGITYARGGYRAAPSAGATYPLDVYLVSADGFFHYLPEEHNLEKISSENRLIALSEAALDQEWVRNVVVNLVITAIFERTTTRYGRRGIGYVYIEVGHTAENVHLQAISLGLVSLPVGAFDDDEVAKVLALPSRVKPIYIIPIGYSRKE
ncbi:MAG TPA: nitroreductase [Elusimicrobia bacterium]|jgi:SagB-type dehydrogenase family enzyme|nr:nitroreductase [Elusimicrobiota bacterium]